MSKKSYMNTGNILNEAFFDKIKKFFGLDLERNLKNDKEFTRNLKGLNRSVSNLEKSFKKSYGKKLKLHKFNLLDFL